jgi:hypothetical protein
MKAGIFSKLQRKLRRFGVARTCSDGVHGVETKRVPMLRRTLIPLMAAVLMASAAISPAHAQRGRDRDQSFDNPFQRGDSWDSPRDDRGSQREVSLSDVLRDLRSKYGGQHLDARKSGGYYMIAWMTEDGRRLNLRVNASTGREE